MTVDPYELPTGHSSELEPLDEPEGDAADVLDALAGGNPEWKRATSRRIDVAMSRIQQLHQRLDSIEAEIRRIRRGGRDV